MSWPNFWLQKTALSLLLQPLSWVTKRIAKRRWIKFKQSPPESPKLVVVVGNIVVGGAGKTPFIQWLGGELSKQGLRYGVISRGYGGRATSAQRPHQVRADDCPSDVGDEPVLLAQSLGCPVVVSPNRAAALDYLLQHHDVDLVISDDGLQHYGLARDIEVVLLDAARPGAGLGNGLCLPAGPLREGLDKLEQVDHIVFNGEANLSTQTDGQEPVYRAWRAKGQGLMHLRPSGVYNLSDPTQKMSVEAFCQQMSSDSIYALAGIGNPKRFFDVLTAHGLVIEPLSFSDHHPFSAQDFSKLEIEKALVMTAKDAVKCQEFARSNWWVWQIEPVCSEEFSARLITQIKQKLQKYRH